MSRSADNDNAVLPKAATDASMRPIFLSKAERQELALLEEVAAQKRRRDQLLSPIEPPSRSLRPSDSDRCNRERERREVDQRNREKKAIKEQYIGSKKSKKRVIKPSEKLQILLPVENIN